MRWRVAAMVCGLIACGALGSVQAAGFVDPLDHPALARSHVATRPMLAAARAGDRLIAVGLRGVAMYSDDAGKSWTQSEVPVQEDLVSVYFVSPTEGWATGHSGVILHTTDAGKTWVKQLDGRVALDQFKRFYQSRIGNEASSEGQEGHPASGAAADNAAALKDVTLNFGDGPNLPFLDVWFKDASTGYAVGSFGTLALTTDGGKTWVPGFERVHSKTALNLNAVRGIAGRVFIAAERGVVFRLDPASGDFEPLRTGYNGSFFGITGSDSVVLAFGLEGTVYRSTDAGDSWEKVQVPTTAAISAGTYDAAAHRFVLVTVRGEALIGNADGSEFSVESKWTDGQYTGVCAIGQGHYLTTGFHGVQLHMLDSTRAAGAAH